MSAVDENDAIESSLVQRLISIYSNALRKAIKQHAAFLRKIRDVDEGRIKPPQYYVLTDTVERWRQGFVRELIRQEGVIDGIVDELDKAGVQAAEVIHATMPEYYSNSRAEAIGQLVAGASGAAWGAFSGRFTQHTRRQLEIILTDSEPPFSKMAYQNMGRNPAIRKRLQDEMAKATILGEGQEDIIRRIQAVTNQATWQARGVAQTERTRIQSQAHMDANAEAVAMGLPVYNTWHTRMVNSRDTHIALNGKVALHGEYFPGSPLRYPGDPTAPAREVINCHCVMSSDVLMPGQVVVNGEVV